MPPAQGVQERVSVGRTGEGYELVRSCARAAARGTIGSGRQTSHIVESIRVAPGIASRNGAGTDQPEGPGYAVGAVEVGSVVRPNALRGCTPTVVKH